MSPTVNIEKLRFQYDAGADFELRIEQLGLQAGKSYLLFGRSGLGKTTLLNLMAGVLRPNSGHIEICGTDLASLSSRATDRFRGDNIGFIFQTLNLIPWLSARDNVELALSFSPERRARLTASLAESLAELFDRLDLDYALADVKARQLSIGQQQRVSAARALIGAPPLLLADEPTSALDAANTERFLTLLQDMMEKSRQTLMVVSHDRHIQSYFDEVIEIEQLLTGGRA